MNICISPEGSAYTAGACAISNTVIQVMTQLRRNNGLFLTSPAVPDLFEVVPERRGTVLGIIVPTRSHAVMHGLRRVIALGDIGRVWVFYGPTYGAINTGGKPI